MPSCVSDAKCCWIVVGGGWVLIVERWEETMDGDDDDGDVCGDESLVVVVEDVLLDAVEVVVDAAKAVPKLVVEMRMKKASSVPRDGRLFRGGWDVMVAGEQWFSPAE